MAYSMKNLTIYNTRRKALVDDDDYERCNAESWSANGTHTVRICSNKEFDGKSISLASFIMNTKGIMYDHKDRDPFNNQKENLRITTPQLNRANTTKDLFYKETTSDYKGVSWHKATKRWRSYITVNNKHISLGYYSEEKNAAKAYDKAAIKHFGEFAFLNFPEEVSK